MKTLQIILFSCVLLPFITNAEGFRGRIVKTTGDVQVISSSGEHFNPEKLNNLIKANETIVTRKDSKAVIQFNDGSMAILNEKSSLLVEKSEWLSQLGGRIYFAFKKIFGKKPRKIKTSFVTLGIRGTSFIVDAESGSETVALQEGSLQVESPGDEFELHQQKPIADEFAAFKNKQKTDAAKIKDEFAAYKKTVNEEFISYVKEFTLAPDKMISFNGNRVDETDISTTLRDDFSQLEEFAAEFIDEYKN